MESKNKNEQLLDAASRQVENAAAGRIMPAFSVTFVPLW